MCRNFKIQDSVVGAAESIAKAAKESNVKQLIHMSHLNAGDDSPSEFMQAKVLSINALLFFLSRGFFQMGCVFQISNISQTCLLHPN